MKLLISSPNLAETLSRFCLAVYDIEDGAYSWVTTDEFIDCRKDQGITGMAHAPSGVIFLAIQGDRRSRIVELTPDLRYRRTIAIDGLSDPHGLVFHDGTLFIGSTGN